jgi:hypothetical protein
MRKFKAVPLGERVFLNEMYITLMERSINEGSTSASNDTTKKEVAQYPVLELPFGVIPCFLQRDLQNNLIKFFS